ncbi:hypothetical protein [Succinimonas sp.]|uniref:hypothetical protein n=1 Tax=Succinimonas sp. TaxID=1936151 RepID=UPI003864712C
MSNRMVKVVIGFLVITGAAAFMLPVFFHEDGQDPVPFDVRAARNTGGKQETATGTQTAQAAQNQSDDREFNDNDFGSGEPLGYMDGEEDGFGSLLDDNGAPPPAENGEKVVSGVVVGGDTGNTRGNFVSNPTATGSTPAEAARAHKESMAREQALREERERERQSELEARRRAEQEAQLKAEQDKQRLEAQRKADQERQRLEAQKLEAQKKADQEKQKLEAQKKAEQEKQKLEAQKKAEQEKQKLEAQKKAEQEKQKLEAQKKAEQERQRLEAQKKAEQEKKPAPVKGDAIPKGRYLQLGVFSTMAQAEAARQNFKNKKIRLKKDSTILPGFGTKIDTVTQPGKFILLVGPTSSDQVLNSIKPQAGAGAWVTSR